MKLREILKKIDDANANKEKLREEIATLEHELDDLNARAESAAAAGDEELYLNLTDEASRISRRIYVKKKVIDIPPEKEITEEEVTAAWREYAAEFDKNYNKKYEKFKKVRQELCDIYADMIEDQCCILQTRERIYNLIKPPVNTYTNPDMRFPFEHIPVVQKKMIGSREVMAPNINIYNIGFLELITPMLYADDVIDRGTAERWAAIISGSANVLPEKKIRPDVEPHIDKFGLFINKK